MVLIDGRVALAEQFCREGRLCCSRRSHGGDDGLELVVCHWGSALVQLDDLLQFVERVRGVLDDLDVELLAHGHDVVVAYPTKRFGVLFESQAGGVPFLEELWQRVRWLATNHEEARVQIAQRPIQVVQALKEKPAKCPLCKGFPRVAPTHLFTHLHLLIPTLELPANQGSITNTQRKVVAS